MGQYLKYESQIDGAFSRLGFAPRAGQKEAVNEILTAFLDERKKNVCLSAPTGVGKSVVGAATAEALTSCLGKPDDAANSSISLVGTNVLARQYANTFSGMGNFLVIKGASNYACEALSTDLESQNAEACAYYAMLRAASAFSGVLDKCNACEFLVNKQKKNDTRHLTTNYAYYFIDRLYTHQLEHRDLIVWDEAHLINDLFSDHNAIYFSEKTLNKTKEEIAQMVGITDVKIAKSLSTIIKDCKKGKIDEKNYEAYLHALQEIYSYAKKEGESEAKAALRSRSMEKYSKLNRFSKKFEGLNCKISDFLKYNYEHVFEYKEDDASVSIKPIFVGTMFETLNHSRYNLFMSATVSLEFMVTTLSLNPSDTKFIKLPPTFPKENKQVIFFDPLSLSYKTLQDPKIVKSLRQNAARVVKKHVEDGDRGIILTPSFKLQSEIIAELKSCDWKDKYKLFAQNQGEKLENILAAFKEYKGGPAVLISPSIYEGIDLSGDLSRFQVLIKSPFPSLADKRMKYIVTHHQKIYDIIVTAKIVQGAGRSVRSKDDYAKTYILDFQAQRLFTSPLNIWKDEFLTSFTKIL